MLKLLKFSDGLKMSKNNGQSEKESSQITSQLKARISTNKKFGSIDLDEWLFERLNIKKGYNVLDVGCGTGNHIIKIAEIFPEGNYYGIDISRDSIKEAIEKSARKNLKIKFICNDASDVSVLQDGFFDLILSVYALYYVKNPQKTLAVLKTKLKGNGSIAVMSPYKRNNSEWYSFLSSFMKIPQEIESVANSFMDNEVLPFSKANFSDIKSFYFENKITIPSFRDLKNYWVSNIYHKPEFDTEFEKHAMDFFKKNEKFTLTKRALLVIMGKGN
jgi:ubiquinone/menaquinone biosynthesis C-methylase UbiE